MKYIKRAEKWQKIALIGVIAVIIGSFTMFAIIPGLVTFSVLFFIGLPSSSVLGALLYDIFHPDSDSKLKGGKA